jgi:CheY-like chemotaxis protein
LLVDDNVDSANGLAKVLRLWGCVVHSAHDGFEALRQAPSIHPDVVLLDIGLPGLDGYAVARALRQEAHLSDTMLVALTGYGQEEDQRRSKEAGFDLHMTKPVNLKTLKDLLASRGDGRR